MGWIGVDFDGTLAYYDGWATNGEVLGAPLKPMVDRVKAWLAEGQEVRIVTARTGQNFLIEKWCQEHIGAILPVTDKKDYDMAELWDDRAIRVERNVGVPACPSCAKCGGIV